MFTLNCKGRLLVVDKPLVMGIINTTADSFYEGSRFTGADSLLHQAELMLRQGADMLDIGGQSTRPGSARITAEEELQRVGNAIELIHRNFPEAIISIDTYWSRVAEEAVMAGASIINDISAATVDAKIVEVAARLQTPYCCMHLPGNADTMHKIPGYENMLREILDFFIQKIAICRQAGIRDIIIDPGFGFAKTAAQNFELINRLGIFHMLQAPILMGVSRKSTIWKTLGITADEALNGTTVLHTLALQNGASILRVHDVKEAVEAVKLVAAIKNGQ